MAGRVSRIDRPWARRVGAGLAAAFLMLGVANAATTYTYDGQGRVIQVVYDTGATITYAYDAAGNRTTMSVTAPSSTLWDEFSWDGASWQ